MAFLCRTAERSYPARTNPDPHERWLYSLAILFGVFLRVYRFWEPSLWLDELVTAYAASAKDWTSLWERSFLSNQSPVYYGLVKVLLLFGGGEFYVRLPSVVFGVAAIATLMMTMRRAAGNRAALYAGAILALNSQAIFHSQEARMYGLALFGAALSTYFFVAVVDNGRRSTLACYAGATLLVCYSHLVYTSVLLGQIVVALWMFLSSAGRPRTLRLLLGTQMVLLLLLVPLASLFRSVGASGTTLASWIAPPNLHRLVSFLTWPETTFACAVFLVSLPRLWTRRERLRFSSSGEKAVLGLALIYLAILPAGIILARLGLLNILAARYLLPSLLGVIILAAFLAAKADDRPLRMILWTFVGLAAALQTMVAFLVGPWVAIPREDWRGAIGWIQDRYRGGDVVLLRSGNFAIARGAEEYLLAPLCGFYDRGGMNVVNLPWKAEDLHSSPFTPQEVQERVSHSRQIFVLINNQLGGWNWELLEEWVQGPGRPPRRVENRAFQVLEVRVYRLASDGPG